MMMTELVTGWQEEFPLLKNRFTFCNSYALDATIQEKRFLSLPTRNLSTIFYKSLLSKVDMGKSPEANTHYLLYTGKDLYNIPVNKHCHFGLVYHNQVIYHLVLLSFVLWKEAFLSSVSYKSVGLV
jgi:hypothetical protein